MYSSAPLKNTTPSVAAVSHKGDLVARRIELHCSEALAGALTLNKILFRGDDSAEAVTGLIRSGVHQPLDTSDHPYFELLFNRWLMRKYGKSFPQRTGALFAIHNLRLACQYGPTYLVFPCDGSEFAYASGMIDPYSTFDSWAYDQAWNAAENRIGDMLADAHGDMHIMMHYASSHDGFRRYLIRNFFEMYDFTKSGLPDSDGAEVWFHGSAITVPLNTFEQEQAAWDLIKRLGLSNCLSWLEDELAAAPGRDKGRLALLRR